MTLDLSKVSNLAFQGVDTKDYPDFSDAFVCEAEYDGKPMTDEELEVLNDEHRDYVYGQLLEDLL